MAGISITLGGNFSKLDELARKANHTAESVKKSFKNVSGSALFEGAAIGAAAAGAAVGAMIYAVKQAVDAGGELNDMMARTGAAGKGLVVMQQAFKNAGMEASQVPQALNKMQKALAGLNEEGQPTNLAFEKLGLSISELVALDPVDAFQKTAEAISAIPDPSRRAAIAMELFSKSGGQMLAVINDPKAFSGAAEQVGSLGSVLSANAANLDTFGDSIGTVDLKVKQLGAGIASELIPMLLQTSDAINKSDFVALGQEIGSATKDAIEFAGILAKIAATTGKIFSYIPGKIIGAAGSMHPTDGKALPPPDVTIGADGSPVYDETHAGEKPLPDQESASGALQKPLYKFEAADHSLADEMKDAQASAAKKAQARAAAIDEGKLDRDILAARLRGDDRRLAMLEREKSIREEIKRLESAGFTPEESRIGATKKVDLQNKVTARETGADEKRKIQETLAGKVNDVTARKDALQYESSIGSISDMQRIGGGGGAVSSGLDYQRQSQDLQRELNGLVRDLIIVSRGEPSGA